MYCYTQILYSPILSLHPIPLLGHAIPPPRGSACPQPCQVFSSASLLCITWPGGGGDLSAAFDMVSPDCLPSSFIKTPSFQFQLIRLCTSYLPCLPPSLTDPQFTVTCFLKIQPPAYFAFPTHFFFLFNSSSPSDLTVPTIQQSWLCLFPTILLSSLTCLWNVESMTNQDNHSLTPSPSPLTLFYSLELQVYVHFTALVGPHETGGKLSVQTGLVLNSQLLILHLCSFAMPSVLLQVNSPNSWQRLIILLCSRYLLSYLVKDITPVAWHTVLLNHASSLHLANLSHQHTNMVLLTPW